MVKILAIDLDGTLCKEDCWTEEEALNATPNKERIEYANKLAHNGYFVIIYTARLDELIPATLEWLRRNNVRYDAICNQKMACDIYVDDKAKTFDELRGDGNVSSQV